MAIGGAKKSDHVSPIFEKLKWLKMEKSFLYSIRDLVFKIKNKMLPDWLFSFPTIEQSRNNQVNTRNQDMFLIPRVPTDTGARNLIILGPKLWN
ncbi:MAG: hypothetical protein AAGK97_17580, partial [Bacteroidota bacterium]